MNLVVESAEPNRKEAQIARKNTFPELQKDIYTTMREIEEAKARIKYNKE